MPDIQFTILETLERQDLIADVERLAREGWLLHGPLTAIANGAENKETYPVRYIQAMIRESGTRRAVGFSTSMP